MKKRLLAWLLAGAMIGSMMPAEVSAAEGIQSIESSQEQVGAEALRGQAEEERQSLGEAPGFEGNQGVGEMQDTGGNQGAGENQVPGGNPAPGENQDPGSNPGVGENQDPGSNPGVGENQDPGGNPGVGENQDPGGNPGVGENQDPGSNPAPGEDQDPGGNPDPGENKEPEDNSGEKNPGETPELADPSDPEANDKHKPNRPGTNQQPVTDEEPPRPSVMPADEEGSAAEDAAPSQDRAQGAVADTQEQDLLDGWDVPLDGMQFTYLQVPGNILARAEAIDADSQELKEVRDGLARDVKGSQKYRSAWDKYSSNYIYNHLSAAQKKFWDALDYICYQYLTKELDADRYPYSWDKYYGYSKWKVMYGKIGLTYEQARSIYIMFAYSNPQYYFLDSSVMIKQPDVYSPQEWMVFFYGKFSDGQDRRAETAAVSDRIQEMKKIINQGKSDVEKARIAHDLIIRTVDYDHTYLSFNPKTIFHQSAYSALCEGYTVCAGYAKAYELLMNAVGIDTMAVTSSSHAWNLIRLNDSWYHVDCTWDDKDGAGGYEGVYTYFGRKTSRISGDLDKDNFHQMEYFYNKKVPKCTQDSGATLTSIGSYKTPASQVKRPVLKTKKVSGGMQVTLKTATSGASIYYTLDGKEPSTSFSRCYRYTKPFKVTSNVTVKAIAVKNQSWDSAVRSAKVLGKVCTVKFNAMGGKKVSSKKVYYNTKMKKPSAKRSGYRFVGWYKDKKCKKVWNFKSKVKKNMTLYAKWKRK